MPGFTKAPGGKRNKPKANRGQAATRDNARVLGTQRSAAGFRQDPCRGPRAPALPLGDQRPNLALERRPNASLRRSSQNRNWPRHRAARKGARESSSGRSASRGRRSRLGDWGTDLVLGPVGGSGGRARDSTEAASAGPGGMPKALGEGARVSGPGAGGRRIKDGQGLPASREGAGRRRGDQERRPTPAWQGTGTGKGEQTPVPAEAPADRKSVV